MTKPASSTQGWVARHSVHNIRALIIKPEANIEQGQRRQPAVFEREHELGGKRKVVRLQHRIFVVADDLQVFK